MAEQKWEDVLSFGEAAPAAAPPSNWDSVLAFPQAESPGLVSSLRSGFQEARSQAGIMATQGSAERLRLFDLIEEKQRTLGVDKAALDPAIAPILQQPEYAEYFAANVNQPERKARLRAEAEELSRAGIEQTVGAEQKLAGEPVDPISQVQSFGELGSLILRDPLSIVRLATRSLPQMLPSIATGTVGMPGLGSYATESAATILDELRGAGVDLKNPDAIRQALANPELMARAKAKGEARGIPIGVFDQITAGIGGKVFAGLGVKALAGRQAVEVGGGMGGEAAAQVASEGRVTSPVGVALEGLAEVPGGLVQSLQFGGRAGLRSGDKGEAATQADLESLLVGEPPAGGGMPADTVRSTVDLRSEPAFKGTLTLGPEQEVRESAIQTTGPRPSVNPPEAQQRTADFFSQSGAVPKGNVTAKKPYTVPRADEIPPEDSANHIVRRPNAVLDILKEAAAREEGGLMERLAKLPQATSITQGAPGVKGNAKAVRYARQAAFLRANANRAKVEGQPDTAKEYLRDAMKAMAKATISGFEYTSQAEVAKDNFVKQTISEVAAMQKPVTMEARFPLGRGFGREPGSRRLERQLRESTDQQISETETRLLDQRRRLDAQLAKLPGPWGVDAANSMRAEIEGHRQNVDSDLAAVQKERQRRSRSFGSPEGFSPQNIDPAFRQREALSQPTARIGLRFEAVATSTGAKLFYSKGSSLPKETVRFIKEIQSALLPNLKLIIDTNLNSEYAIPGASGTYSAFRDNWGVLWLDSRAVDNDLRMATVLTHELGHAIVHQHWTQAGADTQQAIYAAFNRHIASTMGPGSTAEQMMTDLHSPYFLAVMKNFYEAQGRLKEDAAEFMANSVYSNWWSFDEWMAEQASKWMFTNRKTVTLLDKFFARLGQMLEDLLRFLGKKGSDFLPAREVQSWLDSLLERRATGQTPLSIAGTLDAYGKGVRENARSLGEPVSPSVPTPQAENIGLRTFAAKMPGLGLGKTIAQKDRWGHVARIGTNLLQIAANNPHITGLRNYVESIRQWNTSKMGIVTRSNGRLLEWRKLGKEQATRLSDFMFDIDAMVYLPAGANARWPTTAELIALAKQHKLNREAVTVYTKIKGDFLDVLSKIESSWIKRASQIFAANPKGLANAVAQIQSEMNMLRSRPYFPHERFGDWTVTGRDAQGKVVFHAQRESKRAAHSLEREVRSANPGWNVSSGKMPDDLHTFRGLPPSLLRSMQTQLGLTPAQNKALEGLIFDLAPEGAAVKRFKRRKGTPGFSLNAQRAYANYFLHIGSHIARLEHGGDMEAAVAEVRDSAKVMRGQFIAGDVAKRQGIADWMQRHLDYLMNPRFEAQAIRSIAFHWFFGFNVASATINLTQIPMVAYPYLAARYGGAGKGDVKFVNELRKASVDLRKMFKLQPGGLSSDEIDAVKLGVEELFLDESQAAELAGHAGSGVLDRMLPGSNTQRVLMGLSRASSFMFQTVEKINRRLVFITAYRLAKKDPRNKYVQEIIAANPRQFGELLGKGWTATNAGAFLSARDAVDKTQFEYSHWARPEFIRGKKAAIFAFWMFKQNYLWFLKNDPGRLRAWTVLLLAAGLMGLPGADDLADLARALAALQGKDFDPELELRRWVKELTDEGQADVAMHGLSRRSFGLAWAGDMLGVPIPGIDLSSRLSMGRLVPGAEPALDPTLNFNEKIGLTAMQAVGAAYGVPLNLLRAVESNDPNTFKQYERMLPSAAKQLAHAVRLVQEGETLRSGAPLATFDITDSEERAEVVGQALGFSPTRLSLAWDERNAMRDSVKFWSIQRGVLLDEFADARRTGDREGIADAKEAIKRFNAEAPDPRLKITAKSLISSLKARARRRAAEEQGKVGTRMYEGVGRSAREPFQSGQ